MSHKFISSSVTFADQLTFKKPNLYFTSKYLATSRISPKIFYKSMKKLNNSYIYEYAYNFILTKMKTTCKLILNYEKLIAVNALITL